MYTETALPKLGGQEMVVDALAREFLSLGHGVTVLAQQPRGRWRVDDSVFPYEVVRHPRFLSTRHFVGWYRYFLAKLLQRKRFDVLHAHSIYPCGYLASLIGDRLNMPLVITSHGGDVRPNNPRFRKPGMRERHVAGTLAADALVSISDFTTDGFQRLGAEPSRIRPIPNGVNLTPFREAVPRPGELDGAIRSKRYVLFLGRLMHRKGVDLALDAMTKVPPRGDVELVIGGSGDEDESLRRQATMLGLNDRVRFLGRVGGDVKTYLLQNARALVVPTRGFEPFGLVVLEAFAAGIPVLAGRMPGLGQLVDHGRTGWLFEPENVEQIAAALNHVLRAPISDEMGKAVRREAIGYSWTEIARRHLALFEEVIENRKTKTLSAAA